MIDYSTTQETLQALSLQFGIKNKDFIRKILLTSKFTRENQVVNYFQNLFKK